MKLYLFLKVVCVYIIWVAVVVHVRFPMGSPVSSHVHARTWIGQVKSPDCVYLCERGTLKWTCDSGYIPVLCPVFLG